MRDQETFVQDHFQAMSDMATYLQLQQSGDTDAASLFLASTPAPPVSALFHALTGMVTDAYQATRDLMPIGEWLTIFRDAVTAARDDALQMVAFEAALTDLDSGDHVNYA